MRYSRNECVHLVAVQLRLLVEKDALVRLERLEQLVVVEERLNLGPDREVVESDRSIV